MTSLSETRGRLEDAVKLDEILARLDKAEESIQTLFCRLREEHEWTIHMLADLRKQIEWQSA